jgi:hypothetical protein
MLVFVTSWTRHKTVLKKLQKLAFDYLLVSKHVSEAEF